MVPRIGGQLASSAMKIAWSEGFGEWLATQDCSLAFTTYQAGKLFLVGQQPTGQLSVFERSFDRCMGLYADGSRLYMSTLFQIWRFEEVLKGQVLRGYDAQFVPRQSYVTGDLDTHDLVKEQNGRLLFASTAYSCVATVSDTDSFTPVWKPSFISKLAPEDRCHLNGLALRDGKARYATFLAQTDVENGWRPFRDAGGCIVDLHSNQIVATSLSMPHSPRWYQEKLWVLNSGIGEFGYINHNDGQFESVMFCPGYLRGCTFVNHFAIVGLSGPRHNRSFHGLKLNESLSKYQLQSQCGLFIIDLLRGSIVHWLRIEGVVEELYDVALLQGVKKPMAIGFKTDEIHKAVQFDPFTSETF
ncbi:MAG: TIGR03032 family protein [Anaerolineae bacterium]|nr:TIGR03032 family protein [Gloeobacterales cyanobacterium ES-bin-313]